MAVSLVTPPGLLIGDIAPQWAPRSAVVGG